MQLEWHIQPNRSSWSVPKHWHITHCTEQPSCITYMTSIPCTFWNFKSALDSGTGPKFDPTTSYGSDYSSKELPVHDSRKPDLDRHIRPGRFEGTSSYNVSLALAFSMAQSLQDWHTDRRNGHALLESCKWHKSCTILTCFKGPQLRYQLTVGKA